ncbi:hypothetical protein HU200_040901 [Digitaria exilis]|uniref:UDP-glycosyltransferase n=1 Tax=Digitaria exilis TaxID=1010633 RepID=A0A835B7L7_9POAL|nr:hypothetical protein HU200_040901 [Digitaria exilis]
MGSVEDTATGGDHRRRRRVLFFPLPFQGHINPMFQLAGVLHSRGFAITVFHTHFNAPDASRHPDYHFVPVPDDDGGTPTPGDGGAPPAADTLHVTLERVLAVNRACEAPFRELLAALLEQRRDEVACLVADAHLLTLLDVARELGVPTLVLRTGSAACFRIFMAFPMLCDMGYQPARESELDLPVRELPPYRVRDLLSTSAAGHAVMSEVISRLVKAVATSSGLILNTFDALESAELASLRRDLPAAVQVFDVGPLHKLSPSPATSTSLLRQDRRCLDWLDTQAPASVLYVSFGSLASMSATDIAEAAWGIADSDVPFLWVLRPAIVPGSGAGAPPLPDGFLAAVDGRGVVVGWAPQEEVLEHAAVGAFWTHCGWNSTVEAVCAGVPMLCRPWFGDQMGNARYVADAWRVGVELDGEIERGKVAEAVAAMVMDGGTRRRARELGKRAAESVAGGASGVNVDKLASHIMAL